MVTKFKYLGVELHGNGDIAKATGHRHSCMVAAQSAVNRRLKELRIPFDPMVVGGMFAAATAATGSYGCEVWSTPYLGAWHLLASQCKLQSHQADMMFTSNAWACPAPAWVRPRHTRHPTGDHCGFNTYRHHQHHLEGVPRDPSATEKDASGLLVQGGKQL